MRLIPIKDLNNYKSKSIDPSKSPNDYYELYSVPSYSLGHPEIVKGSEIASTKQVVQDGDILLCKINPRINRVWIVKSETEYITIASSEWIVIRTNEILNSYLYWYFRTPNFQKLMVSEVTGIGGSLTRAQPKCVAQYRIPIAEQGKQELITNVLFKIEELIKKRKMQLAELENLIKSRFVDMFGDPNDINSKWEKSPLGELCTIARGGSPRPIEKFLGGNIPWIKIGDATQGDDIYLYSTKEHIIEEGSKRSRCIKSGSLIFANCGVSLGFARIITFDGCIHDGWLVLQEIDRRLEKVFLLKSLNMCTDYFRKTAPDGTQPNLNTGIMKKYMQVIPPIELQQEYIKFVQQVHKSKFLLHQSLKELEDEFKCLMQKAFNGELFPEE